MQKGREGRSQIDMRSLFQNLTTKSYKITRNSKQGKWKCSFDQYLNCSNFCEGLDSRITVIVCCSSNNAPRFELRKNSSLALKGFPNHPLVGNEQRIFGSGFTRLPSSEVIDRKTDSEDSTFSGIPQLFIRTSLRRRPTEEWSYKMPISAEKLQATRAILLQ